MTSRRIDPLALIFGLLFLGATALALTERPIILELPWMLAAALVALGIWLIASAVPLRRDEDEDPA